MGHWGVYDDENDCAADEWYFFLEKLFNGKKISEDNIKSTIKATENFYEFFMDYLKGKKDYVKIGLCLYLIKILKDKETQIQPLFGIPPPSEIKLELPNDFPETLANDIVECINREKNNIKEEGWFNEIEREKALNHELYLFSKGKKGSDSDKIPNGFEKLFNKQ